MQQWAADAAVDEAARARSRARWLEIQAEEEATLAGTLLDLAERKSWVVASVGAHRVRGVISGVGTDFVALLSRRGQPALIPTAAMDSVATEPGETPVRGDRDAALALDVSLAGVVVPIAAERPDVLIHTRAGVSARGMLRSAGADVLQLRAGDDRPTTTWVPLGSVALIYLL